MHNVGFALEGAWQVLAVGLVLGAGLPAVFALGIRALAYGTGGAAGAAPTAAPTAAPHPVGRVLGIACFALVIAAVLLGILFIVASGLGMDLSFEHGYPTLEEAT